ncbi:MAG TPA: DUF2231 domain-containing protein [Candidatus Binataceae bacterium]|nr:DUF2231 domain-containing protein [Candidatus Binataceae bacterium]
MIGRLVAAFAALFPGAQVLQNLHPLIVHYPVAFLTGAAALYLLAWLGSRERWAWTALWMLGLGTLGAAAAVATGLRAGDGVMLSWSVRDHILEHHKHYMLAAFGLSLLLTGWGLIARPMPQRGRAGFVVLLVVMAALIARGADYGGWMVYGYNAGGSLPQPIEFAQ